jgi:myo-inositol-1(or 4)-monophosphatase
MAVVGEERGGEVPIDGSPYWLIDPICGTRNFASGTPLYSVNLALIEGDAVGIGIVGDPSRTELLIAERGRGAWSLKGGALSQLATSAESQTILLDDGKSQGARREWAAEYFAAAVRADRWDLRSLGTTLALPYLAAGRASAYVCFWVSAVHSAAGSLLATEAGAVLSDIYGEPWTLRSDSLLASATPALHRDLLELTTIPRVRPG